MSMSIFGGFGKFGAGVTCVPLTSPFICPPFFKAPAKTVVVVKAEPVAEVRRCGVESLVRRLCRECVGRNATIVVECNGTTACLRVFLRDVGRDFIEVILPRDGGGAERPVLIPLSRVCAIQCNTRRGRICEEFGLGSSSNCDDEAAATAEEEILASFQPAAESEEEEVKDQSGHSIP